MPDSKTSLLVKPIHKYPRAIFLIIAMEFCERFSFCGLRTILSLYLRNVLLFPETMATIIYHGFIMLCYVIPIIGGIIADSFLGRFRAIYYFSTVYALGNIILCLSAVPTSFPLSPVTITMVGLVLIAAGTGGIKPCVAAFAGEQFRVPQQLHLLEAFFSIFYFSINCGSFMGMVVTPVLRENVHCFQHDTCYALGFGFPAGLMFLALALFVAGKPLYKMKNPSKNIILRFMQCAAYAVIQKFHSRDTKKEHWLDYAQDKYDAKLIGEMKVVLAILFLYIPLPVFWSLFDQQGSTWTFQASRTNGNAFGFNILPDQMQVINPAIVMTLIPLFDKMIYPCLNQQHVLSCPLQRMVTGGFAAGIAFVTAGILELQLEKTYPILPQKNETNINFVNLLPCSVQIVNPFNNIQRIETGANHMFLRVPSDYTTTYDIDILAPYECNDIFLTSPWKKMSIEPVEGEVRSIYIAPSGQTLNVLRSDPDQLGKTLSSKPKVRVVVLKELLSAGNISVRLHSKNGQSYSYIAPDDQEISSSAYMELEHGTYSYTIKYPHNSNESLAANDSILLESGGVYSFVVQQSQNRISFAKLFVMTSPNNVHMLWMVPQYLLLSVGEVMFAIAGLQFSFTQAPNVMKTVVIAAWYLCVALGNLLVICVTNLKPFTSKASEFFLFALLLFLDMMVFTMMTRSYKFARVETDDSSSSYGTEETEQRTLELKPSIAIKESLSFRN